MAERCPEADGRFVAACLAALFALGLASCAPAMRTRAEDALSRGDTERAVELFEAAVAQRPTDEAARAGLQKARVRLLEALVAASEAHARAGRSREAFDTLGRLLRKREAFAMVPDGSLQARIDAQVAWAKTYARGELHRAGLTSAPVAAERRFAALAVVLVSPEFDGFRESLRGELHTEAQRVCQERFERARGVGPFSVRLAAQYCTKLGFTTGPPLPLPFVAGTVHIDASGADLLPHEHEGVRAELEGAFRSSPWFDVGAAGEARATLRGTVHVASERRATVVDKPWTERVPYSDVEHVQVPYSEPYLDIETYWVSAPFTTIQTFTRPCGGTYCTETRPVTTFRQEPRTRSVTRYRTAYRTETRPVTRYREVPRVYRLSATEVTSRFDCDWSVTWDLGDGLPPFDARQAATTVQRELEHDVTFGPAGIYPSRARPPSRVEWVAKNGTALRRAVEEKARDHWQAQFCSADAYTTEAAARCLYGRKPGTSGGRRDAPPHPNALRLGLEELFGSDVDALL